MSSSVPCSAVISHSVGTMHWLIVVLSVTWGKWHVGLTLLHLLEALLHFHSLSMGPLWPRKLWWQLMPILLLFRLCQTWTKTWSVSALQFYLLLKRFKIWRLCLAFVNGFKQIRSFWFYSESPVNFMQPLPQTAESGVSGSISLDAKLSLVQAHLQGCSRRDF